MKMTTTRWSPGWRRAAGSSRRPGARRAPGYTHGGVGQAAGAVGVAGARPRWSSGSLERGRAWGADPGPGPAAPEPGWPTSRASALVRRPRRSRGHSGPALRSSLSQLLWGFGRRRRRVGGNAPRIPLPSLRPAPCATTSKATKATLSVAGQLRPRAETSARTPGTSLSSSFRSAPLSVSWTSSLARPPCGRLAPSLAPSLHPTPPCPLLAPRRPPRGGRTGPASLLPLRTWRRAPALIASLTLPGPTRCTNSSLVSFPFLFCWEENSQPWQGSTTPCFSNSFSIPSSSPFPIPETPTYPRREWTHPAPPPPLQDPVGAESWGNGALEEPP